jgi:hypothetical protein
MLSCVSRRQMQATRKVYNNFPLLLTEKEDFAIYFLLLGVMKKGKKSKGKYRSNVERTHPKQPSAPACVGVLRHTLLQFSLLTCVSLGDIRNIVFYNIFYKFIYVSSFVKKCQINICQTIKYLFDIFDSAYRLKPSYVYEEAVYRLFLWAAHFRHMCRWCTVLVLFLNVVHLT